MAFGNSFNGGVGISGAIADLTQIVSTTKPITRVGGSALVVGDRWVNTSNNKQYAWNGTYFERPFHLPISPEIVSVTTTDTYVGLIALPANFALLIKRVDYQVTSGGVHSVSNFWNLSLRLYGSIGRGAAVSQLTANTQSLTTTTTFDTVSATGGYVSNPAAERVLSIYCVKNASAPLIQLIGIIDAWEIV